MKSEALRYLLTGLIMAPVTFVWASVRPPDPDAATIAVSALVGGLGMGVAYFLAGRLLQRFRDDG